MMTNIKHLKIGIVIISLFLSYSLQAQHHLGAKFGVGISKTNPNFVNSEYSQFQVQYQPSALLGAFYNYDLNDRFYLGTDLMFSQINGQIDAQYYGLYYGIDGDATTVNTVNTGNANSNYYLSYLALPIYIGTKFKSFDLALGLQTGLMVRGTYRSESSFLSDGMWVEASKSSEDIGLDLFDFGINISLGYQIIEKWKVQANYYQGINDLLPADLIVIGEINPWRNSQLTLGVFYRLN